MQNSPIMEVVCGEETQPSNDQRRLPPRAVEAELKDWIVTDPAEQARAPGKALEAIRESPGGCILQLAHHPKYGWAVILSWPMGSRAEDTTRIQLHPDAPRAPRHIAYPMKAVGERVEEQDWDDWF